MKYLIILISLLCFGLISLRCAKPASPPAKITFGGEKWNFPSNVEDAVKTHSLLYKPPGYYYKIYPSGMEVILDYHYMPLDFYNESQPKENLFPRPLHSYVFQFNGAKGIYDSLRQDLEHAYKKKFVLTKGIKDSKYAVVKEFEWDFLTISPEVTVGIKTRYSPDGHYEVVTVRFMYDLPLGQMGIEMGNY